jgi:RNA recognition motif-containing protein
MLNLLTSNTSASTATTCSSSASNSTSTSAAQQLLSQLAIAPPSTSSSVNQQSSTGSITSAIGTCPSTPITKPLGINTNLTNIQNNTQNANMLFQNNAQQQMSPNSALKAKLGIQTASSSNYPLNSLQNQLNAFQKQQTGNTAATNVSSSTNLLAAAAATLIQSLPNATASNLNLYSNNHNHHQNHQASVGLNNHMHPNHPFVQMSPSTSSSAAAAAAASGSSSSSSTCNLNNTLFVGNLHASLQEIDLIQVFRPFGRIVECCKKWLHFGFVKFTTEEEACHAYVTLNGFRLKGRPMRLEFQNRSKKAKIKAILAQAAAVHGVAAAGLMNLNGSAADFNLLSMGSNAQNAQTLAVAASFNSLLTAAATASSNASSSTLDERHLLQQQFQNSSSNSNSYMLNQHNNQNHQSQYFHQQQQQQMSSNKQDQLLNSLFSSEQLLKFASSENNNNQQQQQQHQSSVFQLQIPELNFDLISENQSIQQQQQQNLYDFTELDLKVDDLHLQNHSQNFNFLDVNYSTSSAVSSSSLSSSHHNQKASDDNIVMSLIKNTISPVESPKHDISSSLSTDSGCRSNSFLNDEDSAICSLAQTTTITTMHTSHHQMNVQKKGTNGNSASSTSDSDSNKMMNKMEDFSEHLEFTCSNSSPLKSSALDNQIQQNNTQKQAKVVNLEEEDEEDEHDADVDDCSSDCDTSDDASDIPEEQEVEDDHDDEEVEEQNVQNSSIDSLNDLDLDEITNELHNLSCLTEQQQQKPEVQMYEALIKHSQVMDKDGCVKRMQLNPGCVYTSVNESHSLFIEPNDVLKKLEVDEVEEYNLFSPSRKQSQNLHDFVDHLLSSMRNQFYLGSN